MYHVKTKTNGVLIFDQLPKNTYFAEGGYNDIKGGEAFLFTYDEGTCLLPIIDSKTGLQVIKTN